MLRVFTAFSGYDSQCLALERAGIAYNLVGWSEIDKYACAAHDALFPTFSSRNYGDITKIDWSRVPDFDLFTYSSPCQDFSVAGKQRGGVRGSATRSSLLWECERAITGKKPTYLLMENVAALTQQKFKLTFNMWLHKLERLGYTNYVNVLTASDYGVPQRRKRVFVVSVRNGYRFTFPDPIPLARRLRDVLDTNVSDKYNLKKSMLECYIRGNDLQEAKGNCFRFEVFDGHEIASTVTAGCQRRTDNYVYTNDGKVRALTPRESFRLMGLNDEQIDVIQRAGISDAQQYKLAGNSIVVDVLACIFINLLKN